MKRIWHFIDLYLFAYPLAYTLWGLISLGFLFYDTYKLTRNGLAILFRWINNGLLIGTVYQNMQRC